MRGNSLFIKTCVLLACMGFVIPGAVAATNVPMTMSCFPVNVGERSIWVSCTYKNSVSQVKPFDGIPSPLSVTSAFKVTVKNLTTNMTSPTYMVTKIDVYPGDAKITKLTVEPDFTKYIIHHDPNDQVTVTYSYTKFLGINSRTWNSTASTKVRHWLWALSPPDESFDNWAQKPTTAQQNLSFIPNNKYVWTLYRCDLDATPLGFTPVGALPTDKDQTTPPGDPDPRFHGVLNQNAGPPKWGPMALFDGTLYFLHATADKHGNRLWKWETRLKDVPKDTFTTDTFTMNDALALDDIGDTGASTGTPIGGMCAGPDGYLYFTQVLSSGFGLFAAPPDYLEIGQIYGSNPNDGSLYDPLPLNHVHNGLLRCYFPHLTNSSHKIPGDWWGPMDAGLQYNQPPPADTYHNMIPCQLVAEFIGHDQSAASDNNLISNAFFGSITFDPTTGDLIGLGLGPLAYSCNNGQIQKSEHQTLFRLKQSGAPDPNTNPCWLTQVIGTPFPYSPWPSDIPDQTTGLAIDPSDGTLYQANGANSVRNRVVNPTGTQHAGDDLPPFNPMIQVGALAMEPGPSCGIPLSPPASGYKMPINHQLQEHRTFPRDRNPATSAIRGEPAGDILRLLEIYDAALGVEDSAASAMVRESAMRGIANMATKRANHERSKSAAKATPKR